MHFSKGSAKFPRDLDVRGKPNFADTKFAVTKFPGIFSRNGLCLHVNSFNMTMITERIST